MRKFVFALSALLTQVLLVVPAFAADVTERPEGSIGGGRLNAQLVPITRALGDLADVMEQVFAIMVNNPLLVVFLAASLLTIGIRIFRKVKSAAKG